MSFGAGVGDRGLSWWFLLLTDDNSDAVCVDPFFAVSFLLLAKWLHNRNQIRKFSSGFEKQKYLFFSDDKNSVF